jgi:hypothetical protein
VPQHLSRRFAFTVGLAPAAVIAVAVMTAAVPAAAAVSAGPVSARTVSARTGVTAGGRAARPVLLINGDRLVVRSTPGGGHAVGLLPAAGAGGVVSLSTGGSWMEIPVAAFPYLGRGLDPSLFDLAALQRAETGGRLPVHVTFAGRRPSVPGVTVTRTGRGWLAGYLTAASARTFGAALSRQFRADHGRARYGSDGMFSGGVQIALAGAAAPARQVRPDFPMHTLTVTGSNLQGRPDTGDIVDVFNVDDPARLDENAGVNLFDHGVARYSVPSGHYWAIGFFVQDTRHNSAIVRAVFLPQFTVGDKNAAAHIAERAATSRVTMVTPRPATLQALTLTVIRGGRHGSSATGAGFAGAGSSLWVSPVTRKPATGTLRSFVSATLTSAAGTPGTPYAYNLDLAGPAGIITARQRHVVSPASLATVSDRYYQDVPSTGAWITLGGYRAQLSGGLLGLVLPLRLPELQTQYFSAGQAITWNSLYYELFGAGGVPVGLGGQGSPWFTLRAGQRQSQEWNRYPLHPQPQARLLRSAAVIPPTAPSAFRAGDLLYTYSTPFSDNQSGHLGTGIYYGPGETDTASYALYQNGAEIAHSNSARAIAVDGIPPVRISARPSVIRFVLNAARTGDKPVSYVLSPGSQTVWTWRSQRRPAARVPSSWFCGYAGTGTHVRLVRRCAVQPMMTLNYQVQGESLDGLTRPGAQAVDLAVGHIQLGGSAAITGATAQVSYNDGRSWQPAAVTAAGGGRFRLAFTAPAGAGVTLRVSAADAAGSSITETIQRAYGVASSS